MIGFGWSKSSSIRSVERRSSRCQAAESITPASASSFRSYPAENARPAPRRIRMLTPGSSAASASVRESASIRSPFSAFKALGRLSVSLRTAPTSSTRSTGPSEAGSLTVFPPCGRSSEGPNHTHRAEPGFSRPVPHARPGVSAQREHARRGVSFGGDWLARRGALWYSGPLNRQSIQGGAMAMGPHGRARPLSRRAFLRRSVGAAAALPSAAAILAACTKPGTTGGTKPSSVEEDLLAHPARPDHPVTLPLYQDPIPASTPIEEGATLQV